MRQYTMSSRAHKEASKYWCDGRIFAHSFDATQRVRTEMQNRGVIVCNTEDNGGHAFDVTISRDSHVTIQRSKPSRHNEAALRIAATEIWLGQGEYDDHDVDSEIGCAVLTISVDGLLTLVARDVRELGSIRSDERVEEFVASVGNSRVVYGYIRTNLRIVFPASMNCTTVTKELRLDMSRMEWKLSLDCIGRDEHQAKLLALKGERVLRRRGVEITRSDRLARSRSPPRTQSVSRRLRDEGARRRSSQDSGVRPTLRKPKAKRDA